MNIKNVCIGKECSKQKNIFLCEVNNTENKILMFLKKLRNFLLKPVQNDVVGFIVNESWYIALFMVSVISKSFFQWILSIFTFLSMFFNRF